MELVKHIRDLLYHHDCVVVPGFGGFVTNERPARIDKVANNFYPPSREVGFNARLDHNDGLLISYLSARMSMNYVDVRKLVKSFAREVNQKLSKGRTVNFEGIGQFSVSRNDNLQFDPDPSVNFLTDAYGLSFFRYPALDTGEPAGKMHKKLRDTEYVTLRRGTKRLLRYAAIGIPLIAALSWGAMNTNLIREFSFDISSLNPFAAVVDSEMKSLPVAEKTPVLPDSPAVVIDEMSIQRKALMYEEADEPVDPEVAAADHVSYETTDPSEESDSGLLSEHTDPDAAEITAEAAKDAVPDSEITARPAPSRNHYLVAGSFRNRQNALFFRENLKLEGYSSEVIESEQGFYRVSLFATDNRNEALHKLRQIRAQANLSDTWMLSR